MKHFPSSTLLGLLLGLSLAGYSVFAWAPPTAAPPGGNAEAPLNTSATAQSKLGDMGLGAAPLAGYKLRVAGNFSANTITSALGLTSGGGLAVSGASQFVDNVGIGQPSGTNKLEVLGNIAVNSSAPDGNRLYLKSTVPFTDWAMNNMSGVFRIFNGELGPSPFQMETGSPTNTLYVKNTGSVGIGTSTPGAKLDVNGNAIIKGLDLANNRIENVATPTTGPAAANRAYVDATVSAQAGGGGGGVLITWGYGANATPGLGAPSCPAGYSEAYSGFGPYTHIGTGSGTSSAVSVMVCGTTTNQVVGNFAIQGISACYSNPCNTCRVCVPSSPTAAAGSGVGSGSTVIYYVPGERQGNLGGRGTPTTGADGICNANIPTGIQGEITNVHAFLSTASNDEIQDMHTADPDLDNVVKAWYEAGLPVYAYSRQRDAFEKIADNWTDLLDGSIDVNLQTANFPGPLTWWSGSYSAGSIANICSGWATSSSSSYGNYGYTSSVSSDWINYTAGTCDYSRYLLCAAKSGT